jgi:S1-C subfamily serine protease
MKKAPLYSRSPRLPANGPQPAPTPQPRSSGDEPSAAAASPSVSAASAPQANAALKPLDAVRQRAAWRTRAAWGLIVAVTVACALLAGRAWSPQRAPITQKHIDAAVLRTLQKEVLPSPYARAHAAIRPSVVRVQGSSDEVFDDGGPPETPLRGGEARRKARKDETPGAESNREARRQQSTGSGVVIVDNGTILTNLHVVMGAKKLRVTFWNGQESEALLVGAEPDLDLAVLKAVSIPDDLQAATMRSTADLAPGDQVIAVGFPFGIGPSVSGGVVSGLKREFRSQSGERTLSNLIQFDAAANPGNSGGPLVTMDGAVVGVVTAILNPSEARTFIGIGFAVPIESAAGAAGMPPF